ncbi:MAG TPA: esterase-like activity of phytase family protein [Vicinamibacterales bacterium]|nr:esterase-like activity of phytase family protein [Vicinamibacterales bacterium]
MLRALLCGCLSLIVAGCAPKKPAAFVENPLPLLLWLGEFTRPSGTAYPGIPAQPRFGSISGLAPDVGSGQWIGVIDDRDPSRVAWLTVTVGAKGLEVTPTRVQALRAGPGVPERIAANSDLEAVVALPNGTFVMAEEGHRVEKTGEVWQPALLQVNRDAVVTNVIAFPPAFHITADGKTGLRDNQGFEGLAVTPGGRLIAGLEQPLIEDGLVSFERGGAGRLVEFVPSGATFRPGRQWRYMISPTPFLENFEEICSDGENGLVELLAFSETTLLSMERSCLVTRDKQFTANTVQLFSVELAEGEARKRLLLDFQSIIPRLSPALSRLENFEALTFGPIVNGTKTLLIGSDDNFRDTQKTSFLLFGMK